MKTRVSKRTKDRFTRRIRSFIKDISRPVKLYTSEYRLECPNCYFDKLTGKSNGVCKWTVIEAVNRQAAYEAAAGVGIMFRFFVKGRCPVCQSKGYLETRKVSYISCNVRWDPSVAEGSLNSIVAIPAGFEGSSMVALKTDPKYIEDFKNCSIIEVDGYACKMAAPPVLRGIGDEALLSIAAFTTEKYEAQDPQVHKMYNINSDNPVVVMLSDGTLIELSDGALLEIT